MSDRDDERIGIYEAECPFCGHREISRPYTEANKNAVRARARTDVVNHISACTRRS